MICPHCGGYVELVLKPLERPGEDTSPPSPTLVLPPQDADSIQLVFVIAGETFQLTREDIYSAGRGMGPMPVRKYYVELPDANGTLRRLPIKEVVRRAIRARHPKGFKEDRFTALRARDILLRLDFTVLEAGS